MREAMKKTIILIVLVIVIPACLFADRHFSISHTIMNYSTFSCSPIFLEALSDAEIVGEKRITPGSAFARLALSWEGSGRVALSIGFTSFFYYGVNGDTLDSTMTADYDLSVKIPSAPDDESYTPFGGEIAENTVMTYSGSSILCRYYVPLYSSSNPYSVGTSLENGVTPVAAFTIDLTRSAGAAGVYKADVYAVVTVI